jgi:hypothetical protein
MKILNALLLISLAMVISCMDKDTFPSIPSITYESVEFRETPDPAEADFLIVSFRFRDGDGDLGLSAEEIQPPYNEVNYFYDNAGKLLTIRSRSNPAYAHLPPDEYPYNCLNYTSPAETIYYPASVVDNTFNIVDTKTIDGVTHHGVRDMIYFESNENHFNITVDFLLKNADGSFTTFDWKNTFCQTFDGRFPRLEDINGTIEGTLSYSMTSVGFKDLFQNRVLKLRVVIKDRALHESNVMLTPEFML